MKPIFRRLVNVSWFCFKWGLLLAGVAAGAVAFHLYRQVDETIRSHIEERFAAQYKGLQIRLRAADLVPEQGIELRGLTIVEPGAEGPRAELVHVEEVQLRCQTDLQQLIREEPQITEVVIRRPTLWVTRRRDGTWSAGKLLQWSHGSRHAAPVRIENGTIEVFDPTKQPSSSQTLRDVNLVIAPDAAAGQPGKPAGLRHVKGTLGGDHFRHIAVEGWFDPESSQWSLGGTVEGLDVGPELRGSLPCEAADKLAVLESIRGQGELVFRAQYDPKAAPSVQYAVTGRLSRTRIEDARLPYGLSDVRASFRCDNKGVAVDELTGRSGQSQLRLQGLAAGHDGRGPMTLEGELRQFVLEPRIREFLPDVLRNQWDKYFPSGQIDVRFKLSYDGRQWHPDLTVQCRNMAFTYDKFPYRMEYVQGELTLKESLLRVNLVGYGGGQPIRINGEIVHDPAAASDCWAGWIEARGDELVFDERLFAALPERAGRVVRSLEPRGTCSFQTRLWRDRPEDPVHKRVFLGVQRCAMRYASFPYPVTNIRGRLEMVDDQWTFSELEGTNDAGRFTCNGYLRPANDGWELSLKIAGVNVPLEEELRDALRPNMQQLWNDLRPRGAVDLTADVCYLSARHEFQVTVQARPQSENTWIEPVLFPYRMEKLQGVLEYRDGRVTLQGMRGVHGAVKAAADGYCDFRPDGSWLFRLDTLHVDRLPPDRELMQALPNRLRKVLAEVNPSGPVNLRGEIEFEHGSVPADPVHARWNLVLGLERCSLDCGLKLDNVSGEISLAGQVDGQGVRCRGELNIDSLTHKDLQFTRVAGPIWIDDEQVLLGSWVDRPRSGRDPANNAQPRPISARLFSGTLSGDAWVSLGAAPRYGVQATLSDADLTQCAQETIAGRQNLKGKIVATLDLHGKGRSVNNLGGHGNVHLRQGDVYELPVMIALLKILSIRRPDATAFSQSDMDYRISGNHIYFDQINFKGDAVSLLGKGEMGFDQQIQLTFHAIIGRAEPRLPVIRELIGGASQQIMLLHVDGTLQDPKVRNEALPGVNQALQQLASPGALRK